MLDDNQFPVACNKSDDDKFVCSNVINGKTPVLFLNKDGGCGWYFCDVDTATNTIDYDSCSKTDYALYTEKIEDNDGKYCELKSLKSGAPLASMKIDDDGRGDCCCNPASRCDFDNCCPDRSTSCNSKNACDWCDIDSNKPYLQYGDVRRGIKFACLDASGNMKCTQVPSDYEEHKDYYPEIKKAENRGGATGGLFPSQFCNCDNSDTCKNNPELCSPLGGCTPCNPIAVPGDWACVNHECVERKGQGNYRSSKECEADCGKDDKYTCLQGGCVKDPNGSYVSFGACNASCSSLLSGPITYDETKILKNLLIYVSLGFVVVVLLAVLIYVFAFVSKKIRRR